MVNQERARRNFPLDVTDCASTWYGQLESEVKSAAACVETEDGRCIHIYSVSSRVRTCSVTPSRSLMVRLRSSHHAPTAVGMSVRSTRPGNLFRDGSNELIDASIDSLVRSSVDFDRLFDGIFNSSMKDRVRVEIAKHADMFPTDPKSRVDGTRLLLVHHDDQLGLSDAMHRDHLRSVG